MEYLLNDFHLIESKYILYFHRNIFTNIYWPYKKQTYNFVPKNERQKLLLEIMKNGFYAHELNLYLDNFPNDKERIKRYVQLNGDNYLRWSDTPEKRRIRKKK